MKNLSYFTGLGFAASILIGCSAMESYDGRGNQSVDATGKGNPPPQNQPAPYPAPAPAPAPVPAPAPAPAPAPVPNVPGSVQLYSHFNSGYAIVIQDTNPNAPGGGFPGTYQSSGPGLKLYATPPASWRAIYNCAATAMRIGNAYPDGCPAERDNAGIMGYISNVQLPGSIPVYLYQSPYRFASYDGRFYPVSNLVTNLATYVCTIGACPQIGWIPAD